MTNTKVIYRLKGGRLKSLLPLMLKNSNWLKTMEGSLSQVLFKKSETTT